MGRQRKKLSILLLTFVVEESGYGLGGGDEGGVVEGCVA